MPTQSGISNANPPPGEEVVISGIAGMFPDSDNVAHFRDNLMNKVDMVTADDRRFNLDHPEIPSRSGKINNIERFDASFFGVHYKQAHSMDPMCRMILEKSYEAILDAGVNPQTVRGSRMGVFIGACFSESEKTRLYDKIQIDGFGITGCSRAMLANRISYYLGVTGPSYAVDTACSSGAFSFEQAYRAVRQGVCDSAIVGATNLCLHPYVTLQFSRLGVLSMDGKCKCFDDSGSGYVRAEAICAIFLQRKKDSKRIYAYVRHAKTNCDGYKPEGITYPSGRAQQLLLEEFYQECPVPAEDIAYLEAHATGTKVGDPEEMSAVDAVLCARRKTPLRVGSVKSNIGHTEPVSGLCGITKVVIAYETGYIPPNIHYFKPRKEIDSLVQGRLQVISEKTKWDCGYVALNCFGFGGANCHVLLRHNEKEKKNNGLPEDDIPRLICVSGRTEESVKVLLDDTNSRDIDVEYTRLLHDIHEETINGHLYRAYTILQKGEPRKLISESTHFQGTKRPLWFVFSGMGSQWPGMGASLMKIPTFARAIERCHNVLAKKGLDLKKIISDPDPKIFDNILHCFVGIAAVQIGIVDILTELGIVPDHIIGHSVGELGCAYADGCFSADEMIMAAYCRGVASVESNLIKGSMAAVGLGFKDISKLIPPEVDVACHNSQESSTISGPAEVIKTFVASLTAKGIFAREVNTANIAYHSRYIAKAGPKLLEGLRKVIPKPKVRSAKWISTSVDRNQWNAEEWKYSSPEYHTNNLLSSVLFEESSKLIQSDAICVEIAPHGLMQAVMKRAHPPTVTNIGLTSRGKDSTTVLLTGLGKLYNLGINSKLAKLYPNVEFPVSRGTPMISPLVRWEHTDEWHVAYYEKQKKIQSGERTVSVDLKDEDIVYISGHVIDGRNLFPATGYLNFVWETMGLMRGEVYNELPTVFENVRFLRATNIPKEGSVEMTIMIHKGTGNFEVIESGAAVVTGRISISDQIHKHFSKVPEIKDDLGEDLLPLSSRDIYKELRLRGYNYSGAFRGIKQCNNSSTMGIIEWNHNWVAFMDNMLQMQILHEDSRGLFVPTTIQKMVIDPKKQLLSIVKQQEEQYVRVYVYKELGVIKAGGIEIRGLKANAITKKKILAEPVLEKYQFLPYVSDDVIMEDDGLRALIQIALENTPTVKVRTVEIDNGFAPPIALKVTEILGDLPLIQAETVVISKRALDLPNSISVENKKISQESNVLFAIDTELTSKPQALLDLSNVLRNGGYLISRESGSSRVSAPNNFDILSQVDFGNEKLVLLRPSKILFMPEIVQISNNKFTWLEKVKNLVKAGSSVLLYSQNEPTNGIIGFVNCLRKEPGGENVRCVFVVDQNAPKFDVSDPFYKNILDKNLAVNVFKNGHWGSYRHFKIQEISTALTRHAYANLTTRGDLSSLKWLEGPLSDYNKDDLIEVYFSALNFRDIMTATGKLAIEVVTRTRLEQECVQGLEFSGRDKAGKRVMGMVGSGALATRVVCNNQFLWDVPEDWTLEDAATVPIVYCTALYALLLVGGMHKGQKILIHAGSGGVGQAAINLALHHGLKVFTTVGTEEKRQFIRRKFPQIEDNQIGNSRDTSFEQQVMTETNGKGVDIVLNSLAEEKLLASARCLARGGKFLEIGKFDLANNNPLGMEIFLRECSFHGIMLDNLFYDDCDQHIADEINRVFKEGLANGSVKPLVRTVFEEDETESAFRYMASGKHVGKVLVKLREEESRKVVQPRERFIPAVPRFFTNSTKSYVLVGGLGGLGLELADWLILRGVRNLVLTSRKGLSNGYQSSRIRIWRSYGAKVVIATENVATIEGCQKILQTASQLGEIEGIFNLSVVLRDALLENQDEENFKISFDGKAEGTRCMDVVSRKLCPQLKHFVVFSSVSCGRGNAGQTNYGMANSVMERICEQRKTDGLPALAIQWGAIGDVGLVADMQENDAILEIGGTLQQKLSSCLEVMDVFLKQNEPVVASMVVAEKKVGSGSGNMIDSVLSILGIRDIKTISVHSSLAELGMDSMMAVEIKQSLEREFEVFLTAQDIRTLTFAKLTEIAKEYESSVAIGTDKSTGNDIGRIIRIIGEENISTETIVKLPSMVEDGTPNASPLFLLAGIEGLSQVYTLLAKNFKFPVYCLQTGFDVKSIPDMAQSLLPTVLSKLTDTKSFNIMAYSYGTLIALELASLLESRGYSGKLIFIDGSPLLLKEIVDQSIGSTDPTDVQTHLLCTIMNMLAANNSSELKSELDKCADWGARLELFLKRVPTGAPYTNELRRSICTALYQRLLAAINYTPNIGKLKSPISLVRPNVHVVANLPDDYQLSTFTHYHVPVTFMEGNHSSLLENLKLVDYINETLTR